MLGFEKGLGGSNQTHVQPNKGEKWGWHLAKMLEVQEPVPKGSALREGKPLPQGETSAGKVKTRNRHSVIVSLQFILLVLTLGKKNTNTFSKWKVWILGNIKTSLLSTVYVPSPPNSGRMAKDWKAWKPNSSTAFQICESMCPYLVPSLMRLVLFW